MANSVKVVQSLNIYNLSTEYGRSYMRPTISLLYASYKLIIIPVLRVRQQYSEQAWIRGPVLTLVLCRLLGSGEGVESVWRE